MFSWFNHVGEHQNRYVFECAPICWRLMEHVPTVAPARTFHNNLKVRGTNPNGFLALLMDGTAESTSVNYMEFLRELPIRSEKGTVKSVVLAVCSMEVSPPFGMAIKEGESR